MTHPRQVASDYLLAGLAYCGACGAKLLGTQAKGGRFFYYGCQKYLKQGSTACRSGLVNRAALEVAVMDTLREEVLTDENLTALAALVNREAEKASRCHRRRTQLLRDGGDVCPFRFQRHDCKPTSERRLGRG